MISTTRTETASAGAGGTSGPAVVPPAPDRSMTVMAMAETPTRTPKIRVKRLSRPRRRSTEAGPCHANDGGVGRFGCVDRCGVAAGVHPEDRGSRGRSLSIERGECRLQEQRFAVADGESRLEWFDLLGG
jgi:hypothetical protein